MFIDSFLIRRERLLPKSLRLFFLASAGAYLLALTSMSSFHEEVNPRAYYVNLASTAVNSLLLPTLCTLMALLFPKAIIAYVMIVLCFTTLIANSLFYGYFDAPLPLSLVSRIDAVPKIGGHILLDRVSLTEIALSVLFVITLFSFHRSQRWLSKTRGISNGYDSPSTRVLASCIVLLTGIILKGVMFNLGYPPRKVMSINAVESVKKNGFIGYYAGQAIARFASPAATPPFPGKISPSEASAAKTVSLPNGKRRNLIFIQVESLDTRALDVILRGKPLMENLCRLRETAVYCSNVFAQHRAGATQDAELASLFSIIASNQRPGFTSLRLDRLHSLCDVLKGAGYYLSGFHANSGDFFNREALFLQSGFDRFVDEDGYHDRGKGWFSLDNDFFNQTFDQLKALPQPFFAYLITMQSHGPFRNYTEVSERLDLQDYPSDVHPYLRCMYEVDLAIGRFMDQLTQSEIGRDSIVFIFGDHSSNVAYDVSRYRYNLLQPDEHIPLLIVSTDLQPIVIDKVASQTDFAPTVCDLLGLAERDSWLGESMLRGNFGRAILNYPTPRVVENSDTGINFRIATEDEMRYVTWAEAMQSN